jgi:hypothetical protein
MRIGERFQTTNVVLSKVVYPYESSKRAKLGE